MFILSQAIIPVFVFAVLVNFYHFNPILSLQVNENFTTCHDCIVSPCHNVSNGTCAVNPADNTTAQCITCPEQDGNQQYFSEADCKTACQDPTKCVCDGKCYMCVENPKTNTSQFVCDMPIFKWDEFCTTMVPYQPVANNTN